MAIVTYNFVEVNVILGVYTATDFGAGGVSLTFDEDLYIKTKGASGTFTRSKINGVSAGITLELKRTSKTNDVLNYYYQLDRASNGGAFPLLIKDNRSDGTIVTAESAWIKKLPDLTYKEEQDMHVWSLDTAEVFLNIFGYTPRV